MFAKKNADIMIDAFFDGISGAAIFRKLRRPGAPRQFFTPAESEAPTTAVYRWDEVAVATPSLSGSKRAASR